MYCRRSVAVILTVLLVKLTEAKNEFPSYIKICKRYEPIKDCLMENMELIRPHLKDGIKEMNIPGIDPLIIPRVTLSVSNFKASHINSHIYDATKFVVEDMDLDVDKYILSLKFMFPRISMVSDYEISGKILVLELSGHGKSSANLSNIEASVTMQGELYYKNGRPYLNFKDSKLNLEIGDASVYFYDMFRNNPELTETTNKVINDNIKDFIYELKPLYIETVSSFIFPIVKQVFKTYSMDDLFPE